MVLDKVGKNISRPLTAAFSGVQDKYVPEKGSPFLAAVTNAKILSCDSFAMFDVSRSEWFA